MSKKQQQTSKQRITALYARLSRDDEKEGISGSIENQELICKGWIHHLIHMTAAHLWKNELAVVGKESKNPVIASISTMKGVVYYEITV